MTKYRKNISIVLLYFLFLMLLIGWVVVGAASENKYNIDRVTTDNVKSKFYVVYRLPTKQGKRHGTE